MRGWLGQIRCQPKSTDAPDEPQHLLQQQHRHRGLCTPEGADATDEPQHRVIVVQGIEAQFG